MKSLPRIGATALFLIAANGAAAIEPANPAQIVGMGELPSSVGYVTWTGVDNIDAFIGRWDTPYPYPDTGEYAPGLQPYGTSAFYVDVDVNDGGMASFKYAMQTYDAGVWDWYDILMITPDGTHRLIDKLGKPGSAYGTYWYSAPIYLAADLSFWRDQRVRFVFSVMQDGWGDQTQGQALGFHVDSCPVAPLREIEDADAQRFEAANGNIFEDDPATFHLTNELACLEAAVQNAAGNSTRVSAYRPPAYQAHLQEVWDAWQLLKNRREPECEMTKREVKQEFDKHGIGYRPASQSAHTRGEAFDLAISDLTPEQIDSAAYACGLYRFNPTGDPNHFGRLL